MSDKRSGTAHLHLLHVFSPGAQAVHIYSSHRIFSCCHGSVERSQPRDRPWGCCTPRPCCWFWCPLWARIWCLGWQGLGDLPSLCTHRHPWLVPSWDRLCALRLLPAWNWGPRVPTRCPSCPASAPCAPHLCLALCSAQIWGQLGWCSGAECGDGTFLGCQGWGAAGNLRVEPPSSARSHISGFSTSFVPSLYSLSPLPPLLPPSPPVPLTLTQGFDLLWKAPSSCQTQCSASAETY